MAYEKKESFGAIFKNDKKGNDKAPDYNGTAFFNGQDVKLALWVKEGAKGKFFSVKIENASEGSKTQNKGINRNDTPEDIEGLGLPF